MKRKTFSAKDIKGSSIKYHRFNKEYRTWRRAIPKCTNPNHHHYDKYGGSGLQVDPMFRYSFLTFLNEIGECPEPKMEYSIERLDNNIGYMSGNIKWIKTSDQMLNRANNIMVNYDNQAMPLTMACRKIGVNPATVYSRICRGISFEEALTADRLKRKNLIVFNEGKPMRLCSFVRKYGLNTNVVYRLHSQGLSGDDMLICPEVYSNKSTQQRKLTYNGLSMTKTAWAKYLGINATTITDKLKKGYSIGFICDMYLGREKE